MSLFRKSIVGLDINCSHIRFVEVTKKANSSIVIQNIGKAFLPDDTIKNGSIINQEKFMAVLEELWRKNKIKSKEAILGLSNSDVIMRFVTLPKMPIDKLSNLIKFQISDFMPVDINDYELDYTIIGENNSEAGSSFNVLLVAAHKKMLYNFIEAFDITRVSIKDIKSSVLVMEKVIPTDYQDGVSVVVNLSLETCNILIMNKNVPAFARTVMIKDNLYREIDDISNASFTRNKYIDLNESSSVERQIDGVGTLTIKKDAYQENVNKIASFVADEIRSSITYFQSQNRKLEVNKVFLIGCIGSYESILQGLINNMGTNIEILKPYESLYDCFYKRNISKKHDPTEYAVAISLALYGLGE